MQYWSLNFYAYSSMVKYGLNVIPFSRSFPELLEFL